MLTSRDWNSLNLLRRRRELLGIPAAQPLNRQRFIVKGGIVGATLLGTTSLILLTVVGLTHIVESQLQAIAPDVLVYDQYMSRIRETTNSDQKIKKLSRTIAVAISGVRSGSALFTEISRLVPRSIELISLKTTKDSLELSARAPAKSGIEAINIFQVLLDESPFLQFGTVILKRASQQSGSPARGSAGLTLSTPSDQEAITFNLTALFSQDQAKITRPFLRQLGSTGLSRRIKILRSEGFLK